MKDSPATTHTVTTARPTQSPTPAAATVFMVDDDPGMRKSTAMLLEAAGLPYEAFESAPAFLAKYTPERRGCLILDLHMPGMHGMELIEQLRSRKVGLPIIVASGTGTIPMAVKGMKLGLLDFLEKPVDPDALIDRVKAGLEMDQRQRTETAAVEAARERLSALTPRERQLLKLLVSGMANKQIAGEMGISVKTVENHRASLMQKTGALNAADLTRLSILGGEA
jgi:two-component system response regulator FixJ